MGGKEALQVLNVIDNAQSNAHTEAHKCLDRGRLWFYQPCVHSPLLRNDNRPKRYFLGEAGTKAPASMQSEPERDTLSRERG